jgi:hypothetical protein
MGLICNIAAIGHGKIGQGKPNSLASLVPWVRTGKTYAAAYAAAKGLTPNLKSLFLLRKGPGSGPVVGQTAGQQSVDAIAIELSGFVLGIDR